MTEKSGKRRLGFLEGKISIDDIKFDEPLPDDELRLSVGDNPAEPRAAHVRYDRRVGRIIVDLTNGCTFAFPARLAQGLEDASDEEISKVEILGNGFGLHWEQLDVDHSIPGLLAGLLGTKSYMARLSGR